MSEPGLTLAGAADHGPPDPPRFSVRHIDVDVKVHCDECLAEGVLRIGRWYVVNGVIYCHGCWAEERDS